MFIFDKSKNLLFDIPEDATSCVGGILETWSAGTTALWEESDRLVVDVRSTCSVSHLDGSCGRVVTEVSGVVDTSACVRIEDNGSGATSDNVKTNRTLKDDDTSDLELFSTDSLVISEHEHSLVQSGGSDEGRRESDVSESHSDISKVDGSVLSVSEEEALFS